MPRAMSNGMRNRSDRRMVLYIPMWCNEFRDFAGAMLFHFEYWTALYLPGGINALLLARQCDRLDVVGAGRLGGIGPTSPDSQGLLGRFRIGLWQLRHLVQRLQRTRSRKLIHRRTETGWDRESPSALGCAEHRLDEKRGRRHDHRGELVIGRLLLSAAGRWSVPERRSRFLEGRGQRRREQQRQYGSRLHARRRL